VSPGLRRALLGCLLAAAGCNDERARDVSDGPRLHVAASVHDFGKVVQGQELRHAFELRNTGTRPLDIESVDSGHGCSGSSRASLLLPGERTALDAVCRAKLHGPFRDQLTIRSNDARAARVALTITASALPILAFERDAVEFDVPFGSVRSQELRLIGARARDARLALLDAGHPDFQIELLPASEQRVQGLRVTFEAQRAGTRVGQIAFATGLAEPAKLSLRFSCKVAGTLRLSPTNPYFNLREPGPKQRVLQVQSSQSDFRIHSVRVTQGPFAATVSPSGAGEYRIVVSFLEQRVSDDSRGISGKLLIVSNDRTEPEREVPLLALGKLTRR
jgi:hypothetical protein